jgi:hypothetical protein
MSRLVISDGVDGGNQARVAGVCQLVRPVALANAAKTSAIAAFTARSTEARRGSLMLTGADT